MSEVTKAGVDPGTAGVFTLKISKGMYNLACSPVPGTQCAQNAPSVAYEKHIEVGTVRGTGHTVWFLLDEQQKHQLTGCIRYSQSNTGCGPEGGYRFTWQLTAKGLTFSDFFGIGDDAGAATGYLNFTFRAWTRIP